MQLDDILFTSVLFIQVYIYNFPLCGEGNGKFKMATTKAHGLRGE